MGRNRIMYIATSKDSQVIGDGQYISKFFGIAYAHLKEYIKTDHPFWHDGKRYYLDWLIEE